MARQIKIRFNKQAETTVETIGFVGDECTSASNLIEKALGTQTSNENTADFYRESEVHQHARLDGAEE